MCSRILKSKRIFYNLKENGKREFTLYEAQNIINLLKLNLKDVNDIFFNSAIRK